MTKPPSLPQTGGSGSVPVFSLTIYVTTAEQGGYVARAANLDIEDAVASTPRDALEKIVRASKKLIGDNLSENSDVPWISPPSDPIVGEKRFLIPLHL